MIRHIDITHGDESCIGYYVGLVVSPVFVLSSNIGFRSLTAFHGLHRPNVYSFLLESGVGPNWAQTSRPHRVDKPLGVTVLVWIILDVLEHRTEATFVVTYENGIC